MSSKSYSKSFPERISRKVRNDGMSVRAVSERMVLCDAL
jgi:hypothetical protein